MKSRIFASALLFCIAGAIGAGEPETTPAKPVGDTTVVNFFLPGTFADALDRAKTSQRCLIIKGVAFGIDEAGSKCATKGHW